MTEENSGPRFALIRAEIGATSPKAMSKHLGIGENLWRLYEAGEGTPGWATLQKLAELGFNPAWLITGDGPMKLEKRDGPPTSFDEGFVGQVGEMVEHLFRKEGMRASARELVQVSTRIYAQVCAATADPIDRLDVLKALLDEERAALRDAAARKPGSRKSTV